MSLGITSNRSKKYRSTVNLYQFQNFQSKNAFFKNKVCMIGPHTDESMLCFSHNMVNDEEMLRLT